MPQRSASAWDPTRSTVLATSAQTGGALFAVEIRMPPGGGPPVMHRHDPGEVYYVIEGEFTFYIGLRRRRPAGSPPGRATSSPSPAARPHTIRNESDADAVAFVVHAPGAPMESFSRAAAALAAEASPSIEDVLALAARTASRCWGRSRRSLASRRPRLATCPPSRLTCHHRQTQVAPNPATSMVVITPK